MKISSFDIIGSRDKAIAIIEDRGAKNRKIAEHIIKKHRNVKTVLAKTSPRKGAYRIRDFRFVKGSRNTEVVHKENGCRFFLDPVNVYFSPRESAERLRIAEMVVPEENVMVFFSGIGAFPIVIARKSKACEVYGIELNADASRYALKNIKLNKTANVKVLWGDVRGLYKDFVKKCDRVIMPLPEKAVYFLCEALSCLKKNGICHLYCFSTKHGIKDVKKNIRKTAKDSSFRIRILKTAKVLPYGPGIWKMRMDIRKL